MAFTGPAEDRMEIREVYASYGDASTCANTDDWLACWAEDGTWTTPGFSRTGKAELREQWDMLWSSFEKVAFLGEVGSIEIEGDSAKGRCVAREIVLLRGGGIYKLVGQYHDQFARRNGKWVFVSRTYTQIVEELPAQ